MAQLSPGSAPGLALGEARPPHAGPHPHRAQIQAAHPAHGRVAALPSFLSGRVSRSRPPRTSPPVLDASVKSVHNSPRQGG